jgi:hypothetical protein
MKRTNLTNRRLGQRRDILSLWATLREQGAVLGFGALFVFGVACGAGVVTWLKTDAADELMVILGGFARMRQAQELSSTFLSALGLNLALLVVLFLCGFCAISLPVILVLPWFKGLGFGLSASALLASRGMSAMGYLGVLIMPNMIWSTMVLLLGCRDAMRLSRVIWCSIQPGQARGSNEVYSGSYCARFVMYAMMMAAGAALEAYLFLLFGARLSIA